MPSKTEDKLTDFVTVVLVPLALIGIAYAVYKVQVRR